MLDKVTVFNDRFMDKTFILGEITDGVTVKDISGLGPIKAELSTTPIVNGVGVHYNSRSIGSRNIVFSLGMHEVGGKTVEQVRWDIYDIFPVGEEVELHFESSGLTRKIHGRVESVVPEIFTKDPSIQVSVICVDPYFFDYPGDDNSITLSTEDVAVMVPYSGRVNNGVIIDFTVVALPPPSIFGNLKIVQTIEGYPDRGFNIPDFDITGVTNGLINRFTLGDTIRVSTVQGKKSATLTRAGINYNILGALKDNSGYFLTLDQWPLLMVGKFTTFKYLASVYDSSHLQVKVSWDVLVEGL